MRGFFVLLLAIAGAVIAFVATRHDSGPGRDAGQEASAGTFSRDLPGDHDPDEVRALEPQVVVVRGDAAWSGRVEVEPPHGVVPRRLEVVGPGGTVVAAVDLGTDDTPSLSFSAPLDAHGTYVVRVTYDTGEVWTVSAEL